MAVTIVTPQQVILPSLTWQAELSSEFERLGIRDPDHTATKVLQRILGRAGWQRQWLVAPVMTVSTAEGMAELMTAAPDESATG